jgi:hypothetical protein
LPSITRIAPGNLAFGRVKVGDEPVSIPYGAEPPARLHGLRKQTDVFRRQPVDVNVGHDSRGVEQRPAPEAVIDDVVPHPENQEMPDKCFIQHPPAKPIQVVQVTDLTLRRRRRASPPAPLRVRARAKQVARTRSPGGQAEGPGKAIRWASIADEV